MELGSFLTECEDPVLGALGIAICGCGWFAGRAHLPAIQKLMSKPIKGHPFRVRLVALCSRSQASMDKMIKRIEPKYRDVRCYTCLDELLRDPCVHIVDLVLPISDMSEAIVKVINAGKCVLSEKPFAADPEHAVRLWSRYAKLEVERSVAWCVLENWAWKPALFLFQELLQVDPCYCLILLSTEWRTAPAQPPMCRQVHFPPLAQAHPPRTYRLRMHQALPPPEKQGWRRDGWRSFAGGWLLDVGVHAARVARELFGEVETVRCRSLDRTPDLLEAARCLPLYAPPPPSYNSLRR
jgi:predicted dehydrogenase